MFNQLGTTEILIITVVLIVLFGSKRIADMGRELGRSSKELKKVKKEYKMALEELENDIELDEEKNNESHS